MNSRQKKIFLHSLACLVFLSLPILLARSSESLSETLQEGHTRKDFIAYGLMIGAFYLNYFILIPRLYFQKKTFLLFLISQIGCFILIAFLLSFIHFAPRDMHSPQHWPHFHSPQIPLFTELKHHLFLFLLVIFISLTLHISQRWQITEKEKVNAELSFLKAQINPHFLFNTLNGIYSLAIQKSDNAPDAIVKLSEMMRYILTDAAHPFVSLKKELYQVNNYIELQKIRLGNTVSISYTFSGDSENQQIAPLILIHFIENAFKHGVNPDENSGIDITVNIKGNTLLFKVSNKKVSSEIKDDLNSGTGIENSRTRLQILYPDKHKLKILNESAKFTVELELLLS
jgi:LytS/YehU family sensor histidine kinase